MNKSGSVLIIMVLLMVTIMTVMSTLFESMTYTHNLVQSRKQMYATTHAVEGLLRIGCVVAKVGFATMLDGHNYYLDYAQWPWGNDYGQAHVQLQRHGNEIKVQATLTSLHETRKGTGSCVVVCCDTKSDIRAWSVVHHGY